MATKYNLVVTIDPIVISDGSQARAVAAAKLAKSLSNKIGRDVQYFLNGERAADGEFTGTNPGITVAAQLMDEAGKVTGTKKIDSYSVAAKSKAHKFKAGESAAPSESFDLEAFLSKQ